ncbi:sulfotransferase [Jannaschia seohaensis]|uniref:sulfotransferase n=1 Tax=Jannaschia seohaensis TaxID=475081 RepID=UPI0024825091|nr:sulfotransferase [Jannaschia seohaensis]
MPADRLLVFTPANGCKPLCRFLGVPVPETDFPRSNARDEFWAMFGGEPITACATEPSSEIALDADCPSARPSKIAPAGIA